MFNSPIEEIKSRLDILDVIQGYIKLQRTGANWRARCPFHAEKSPSFFVSPSKQLWRCFGCSAGGDVFKFVMQIEGVEFRDALHSLAKRAGVELRAQDPKLQTERTRLLEISEIATQFFEKQLLASTMGKKAGEYLLGRNITEASIKEFRLGYAPDEWRALSDFLVGKGYNREEVVKAGLAIAKEGEGYSRAYDRFRGRIMFPVFDAQGQVIGFGGRVAPWREKHKHKNIKTQEHKNIKTHEEKSEVVVTPETEELPKDIGEPKYLNTPQTMIYDKSRVLYGLHIAKVEIRKNNFCIMMEGYTDVILSAQHGIRNIVSSSGTALTLWQLKILKRYTDNLHTAYDMDLAGDIATRRGIDLARRMGFQIKVITLEEGKDPADVISENPTAWEEGIANAKSIMEYYFDSTLERFDAKTAEGKREIGKALLPVIRQIPNAIEQSHWVTKLSHAIGVREEHIHTELKKVVMSDEYNDTPQGESGETNAAIGVVELPKTRQGLLEEQLLSLMVREPSRCEFALKEDIQFGNPQFADIFFCIKKEAQKVGALQNPKILHAAIQKEIPEEKREVFEQILLRSEFESGGETEKGGEFEAEVMLCITELKNLSLRGKLRQLSNEIAQAEEAHDEGQAAKLLGEYAELSGQLQQA